MVVLGIDPGTIVTGYGVISFSGYEFSHLNSGIIKPKNDILENRLKIIYEEIVKLIQIHRPTDFSIETAFYGKNVQSAMKIGYARGVSILAAVHNGISSNEYSPREVKKAVVGKGAASKEQVQFMVRKLLNLGEEKLKLDESDALAVAICHAIRGSSPKSKSQDWKSFVENNQNRIID
jgi:crossover junction endodeoxyribonuclease RuvC